MGLKVNKPWGLGSRMFRILKIAALITCSGLWAESAQAGILISEMCDLRYDYATDVPLDGQPGRS
jgi:hypothetical protein